MKRCWVTDCKFSICQKFILGLSRFGPAQHHLSVCIGETWSLSVSSFTYSNSRWRPRKVYSLTGHSTSSFQVESHMFPATRILCRKPGTRSLCLDTILGDLATGVRLPGCLVLNIQRRYPFWFVISILLWRKRSRSHSLYSSRQPSSLGFAKSLVLNIEARDCLIFEVISVLL